MYKFALKQVGCDSIPPFKAACKIKIQVTSYSRFPPFPENQMSLYLATQIFLKEKM